MDISNEASFSHYPTRFQGARLPASRLELRDVTTVLFLLEQGPLENSLSNLLCTAAVCREIELQRPGGVQLKIMGESQFWNSAQGFGENLFERGISAGDHALLLTAASIYKRQMARLIGAYALANATLDGFPDLVDDEVAVGRREDPHTPIRALVEAFLRDSRDAHVRELLRLAQKSEDPNSKEAVVEACRGALGTLQTLSLPLPRRRDEERVEMIPMLNNMIREWSWGALSPTVLSSLIERHDDAARIAESIWSGAEEIAPGVFQLIEYPYEETDDVIRDQLKEAYTRDPRALYVLEKGEDTPSTKLSFDEAVSFSRRLSVGEDPQELLSEVEALMRDRGDASCAVDIAMGEIRERDPRDTLEKILERAEYIPDPGGVQYTVFKSPEVDLFGMMRNHGIPIIAHNTLWLHDLKAESARPFMISFQGQYLTSFLSLIGATRSDD